MKNKPQISVIMCVFNTKKEFFYSSVKSILNQTFVNFELLIIDDGSTITYDDFPFIDERIKFYKNIKNSGISFSRNVGLKNAKGKYIAIMDSDDIARKERLQKQFEFMEANPDVAVCGTWFRFFGDKHHEVKRIINNHDYYRCCLLFGNSPTILDPSTLIRKSILDKNEIFYDESLKVGMDYLFWIRLSQHGKIVNYPEILMHYRVHNNQITKSDFYRKNKVNSFFFTYQLEKLECRLDEDEINLFLFRLTNKKINLLKFIELLELITNKNKLSHYFNDAELSKRCNEELRKVILFNKNIFWIIKYLFNRKTSKIVLKTELSRAIKR